jgi:hypothetical protein
MRISVVSSYLGLFGLSVILASASFADDNDSAPTPPNQSDVKVEKSTPKAGVTGVQSQSAGPTSGQSSLDPSRQSSMGLGIQIPFHKEKEAPAANPKNTDGDSSKQ